MICSPFQYGEYRHWRRFASRLLIGSLLCMIASSHQLFDLIVSIVFTLGRPNPRYYHFKLGLDIVNCVKVIVTHGLCSVMIIRISLSTRRGLAESDGFSGRNNTCKRNLQHRMFLFSLVPLVNLFLCLWPTVIIAVRPLIRDIQYLKGNFNYKNDNDTLE